MFGSAPTHLRLHPGERLTAQRADRLSGLAFSLSLKIFQPRSWKTLSPSPIFQPRSFPDLSAQVLENSFPVPDLSPFSPGPGKFFPRP